MQGSMQASPFFKKITYLAIRLDFIYVYLKVACNFVRRPKDLSVCGFQFCLKTLEKKRDREEKATYLK